jgi:hypothetical protein
MSTMGTFSMSFKYWYEKNRNASPGYSYKTLLDTNDVDKVVSNWEWMLIWLRNNISKTVSTNLIVSTNFIM